MRRWRELTVGFLAVMSLVDGGPAVPSVPISWRDLPVPPVETAATGAALQPRAELPLPDGVVDRSKSNTKKQKPKRKPSQPASKPKRESTPYTPVQSETGAPQPARATRPEFGPL